MSQGFVYVNRDFDIVSPQRVGVLVQIPGGFVICVIRACLPARNCCHMYKQVEVEFLRVHALVGTSLRPITCLDFTNKAVPDVHVVYTQLTCCLTHMCVAGWDIMAPVTARQPSSWSSSLQPASSPGHHKEVHADDICGDMSVNIEHVF